MQKWIFVLSLAITLSITVGKAQEEQSELKKGYGNEIGTDATIGFSNLLFDGVRSNGFNIGLALINISNATGMNYGIDWSYSGYLKKGSDYQSILSMGPSTGIKFCSKSGYAFEIGVTTGISLVKVNDQSGLPYEGACFNGKSMMSMGYKNYTINLEGCYYTSSKYDFTSFSINFKYMIKNRWEFHCNYKYWIEFKPSENHNFSEGFINLVKNT